MRIDGDHNRLARAHFAQLSFLEIGDYPHIRIHQRQQRLAHLHKRSRLDAFPGHVAGDRSEIFV